MKIKQVIILYTIWLKSAIMINYAPLTKPNLRVMSRWTNDHPMKKVAGKILIMPFAFFFLIAYINNTMTSTIQANIQPKFRGNLSNKFEKYGWKYTM